MMLSRDVPTEAARPGDPVSKAGAGGRSESVPVSLPPPAPASGCRGRADSYLCPQGCYLAPEPATSFLAFPLSVCGEKFLWSLDLVPEGERKPLLVAGPSP